MANSQLGLFGRDILKPGGSFLEVDVTVGNYTTLVASLVGSKGYVLALEPRPYAYNRVETVLKSNCITQVDAFQLSHSPRLMSRFVV